MQLISKTISGKLGCTLFSCELKDETGIVHSKTVSYADYVNWLADSAILLVKDNYIHLGAMPKGYFNGSFKDNQNFIVYLDYPAQQRDTYYMKKCFPQIPYPAMIFKYRVEDGEVLEKTAFCYKGRLTEDSELYRFPFGNISSNGSMCYGNIRIGKVTRLTDIDRAVSLFFDGQMSNDYFSPEQSHSGSESLLELLKILQNEEFFPDKILMPINKTLKEFMKL